MSFFKTIALFFLAFFSHVSFAASPQLGSAAELEVTHFAGTVGGPGAADGIGPAARFFVPRSVWGDGQFLYVAEISTIRRVEIATAQVTTIAGLPQTIGYVDAVGEDARFWYPDGLWGDGKYLYVSEFFNRAIRRIDLSTREVTTFISGLNGVGGIWGSGELLYAAANTRILKIHTGTREVVTFAGSDETGQVDGRGVDARFTYARSITGDGENLYVMDAATVRRMVIATADVTTIGSFFYDPYRFNVYALWTDGTYIYNGGNFQVLRLEIATRTLTSIAGSSACCGGGEDGVGIDARLDDEQRLWGDGQNLYLTQPYNNTIRKLHLATRQVTTLAGYAAYRGTQDSVGTAARFRQLGPIAGDTRNLYVIDHDPNFSAANNPVVRSMSLTTRQTQTLPIFQPSGLWSDGQNLFVSYRTRIERFTISTGAVTPIAGSPTESGNRDGRGSEARFAVAGAMWGDGTYLYVADAIVTPILGCRLQLCGSTYEGITRKIDLRTGDVTTLPGRTAPSRAVLRTTFMGSDGRFLYLPGFNNNIERISISTGEHTFVDYPGMGPEVPIWVDGRFLYVAGSVVQRFDLATHEIKTLAGLYGIIGSEDGIGSAARFREPGGIWGDGTNLYVSDKNNAAIRKLSLPGGPPDFTLAPRGGMSVLAEGSGAIRIGYVRAQADPGSLPPAGFALFSFRQNGVLISEAGVPASPTISGGRIYAELSDSIRTGIAIANPNAQPVNVSFFFTDDKGVDFGAGVATLPANGRFSSFLDESPFGLSNRNVRTFTFSTSLPVSVIALRGLINERSEFLMTTLPVGSLSSVSNQPLVFPQFADGGGWKTEVILVNPTGQAMTGSIEGFTNYSIPPRSAFRFAMDGTGDTVRVGSLRVIPVGSAPVALVIFSYRRGGVTVTTAGVPASPVGSAFRMYAEQQSGVSIANTGSLSTDVTFELTNLQGQPVATTRKTIVAGGHLSLFLSELPNFDSLASTFQGTLRVTGNSISVLGLRGRYNERGDFLITTTPAIDEAAPPASDLIIPHVVEGGGYTTQIVLLPQTNSAVAGTLDFVWQ